MTMFEGCTSESRKTVERMARGYIIDFIEVLGKEEVKLLVKNIYFLMFAAQVVALFIMLGTPT